jgi:rhamnose utilization protein RhaD (predicted bifunctional aldolase and dehydrogenase)/NAD(P)-dependent dehydrogenase (short-subunit alcohol dehydrogenase family)
MDNRYDDAEASRFAHGAIAEALALRTYTARLLGADPSLVLHGGGNTSAKGRATTLLGETIDVLWIKGSGWDLATIEPPGHPAVRLAPLLALRALDALSDEDMVNALRLALLDAAAPTPSVEALLHAFLPARFIDHTHADAVLAVTDQPDGEAICREIYGTGLVWVPYVMPGFALAKRCAAAYEELAKTTAPSVIVLERHGIFSFGETAKESYARMIHAVTLAERFAAARRPATGSLSHARPPHDPELTAALLPRLRGALAEAAGDPPERGPILVTRTTERLLDFVAREDAPALSQIGCATPDHVLRTKPVPLFLRDVAELDGAIAAYARAYDAYFDEMTRANASAPVSAGGVAKTKLDPWPRVVLVPKVGIIAVGKTRAEAEIAADVYEHTVSVVLDASAIGTYAPVGRADLFDVEYWSLEQAKLKKTPDAPLARAVALVTGAASGIGRATAARFAELGAHVMMVDRDPAALVAAHAELPPAQKKLTVHHLADVTDAAQVTAAVAACVRAFGGLDVVVSNAGTAPEGQLHTAAGDATLRASLDVNLLAHNTVARAAADVLLAQGRGGCLLFNASKSAFNPGPGFGPYAVAKTALIALMRQYAVDLGKRGVRANAINADRVRTALFGGGVLESRAKARGLTPDQYFRANLLEREVTARDVADAFAYLARARTTTGCVITVDGGNAAAFPR